jgi:hypothetical protein
VAEAQPQAPSPRLQPTQPPAGREEGRADKNIFSTKGAEDGSGEPLGSWELDGYRLELGRGSHPLELELRLLRGGELLLATSFLDAAGAWRALARARARLGELGLGKAEAERALREAEAVALDAVGGRLLVRVRGGVGVWEDGCSAVANPARFYVELPSGRWLGELTFDRIRVVEEGEDGYVERERLLPLLLLSRARGGSVEFWGVVAVEGLELELDGYRVPIDFKAALDKPLKTLATRSVAARAAMGERVSVAEVYPRLLERNKRFVDFSWDERLYHVFACYAVATYFYFLLTAFPQLVLLGSRGAGKTRVGLALAYASHRGLVVTDPTEASMFRLAEGLGATLYIDDELGPAELLIHVAYKGGVKVPRAEQGRDGRFRIYLYETYIPVIVGAKSLEGSPRREDIVSRAILVSMRKGRDPHPKGRDPRPEDFADLREELYLAQLWEWPRVLEAYEELAARRAELGLEGRDFEVWGPLLAVAKLAGEEAFEAVLSFARENIEEKREELYVEEKEVLAGLERLLLYRLEELVKGGLESFWRGEAELPESERERLAELAGELERGVLFSAADLYRAMLEVLARGEGEDAPEKPYTGAQFERKWNPQRLGRFLSERLGGVAPRDRKSSRVLRRLKLSSLVEAAERYGYELDARLLRAWDALRNKGLGNGRILSRECGNVRNWQHSQHSHTWGEVGEPKDGSGVSETHECVEGGNSFAGMWECSPGEEGGSGRHSQCQTGNTKLGRLGEAAERVLEFAGWEGKPLYSVFAYAVRELKILRPEPLLRELLERGWLVKLRAEDGTVLLARGR